MATFLYVTLVLLVILLIMLVEAVILTWMKWAGFRQCLVAAFIANLVSTVASLILLTLVDYPQYFHLLIGLSVSLLIDTLILLAFKRRSTWSTLKFSLYANLASYLVLIFPVFYFGQRG